jgi:hypothetical protein
VDVGPVDNVDAQEGKHPGHGEGKVGQICQGRAVLERNVVLVRR